MPGGDVERLIDGPFADPATRRHLQDTCLRRTVRHAARVSPYYREVLAAHGIDPSDVAAHTIEKLPLTRKPVVQARAADFVAEGSRPFLSTRSTGTTGQPIWMSRYEADLWPALAACHVLGLIPAAESVRSLAGPFRPTLLVTYPSYLADMVHAARGIGLGPGDFGLRRIDCGGEVLSADLAAAATKTFAAPVTDTFTTTEVLPVSRRICSQGHLHHDLATGFVEVVNPATGHAVAPGDVGTVAVTPYFPYRECMPLLRYETRDMVRRLAEDDLTCELAGVPATSAILGNADHPCVPAARPAAECR